MTASQINTLTEIAGGSTSPEVDVREVQAKEEANKINQWVSSHKNIEDAGKKTALFTQAFQPSPVNRDSYWDTLENIMPGSKENARQVIVEREVEKLQGMATTIEKENYLRDVGSSLPRYAVEKMFPYMQGLFSLHNSREAERARIASIEEAKNILREKGDMNLSPEVGVDAHVSDFINAYNAGYTTEIDVDQTGRLTVPVNGKAEPVYSLQKPSISLEEEYISFTDLSKPTKALFKEMQGRARKDVEQAERTTTELLLNRYDEIPTEMQANVLIDGVTNHEDPFGEARAIFRSSVKKKMETNEFSFEDIREDYYSQVNRFKDSLVRRVADGYVE